MVHQFRRRRYHNAQHQRKFGIYQDVVDECPTHLFDYRLDISEIPSITVRINESIAFSLIIQPQIGLKHMHSMPLKKETKEMHLSLLYIRYSREIPSNVDNTFSER